ncbi:MAG: DUF3800 domain-containing protein [Alphaproteobacteria bacterium]
MEFYLDESGNTGGISKKAFLSSYGGQNIFTLSAIGVSDEAEANAKVASLLKQFNINSKELKSSRIYKKKSLFIVELLSYIRDQGWPIFIEAVDKKFMLTANLVNTLIFPGYCFESETRKINYIRNVFAEYLYDCLPDSIYTSFLNLCETPSPEGLISLINQFICVMQENTNEVSCAIAHSLSMTRNDVEENILGKAGDISEFLPIPDAGKRGKLVWMLPNLSSFTNIYARINMFLGGDLSNVKIYHDEQLQYEQVIEAAKHDVENMPFDRFGFVSDSANYKFEKNADLFFKASHESIGIQVADILAGFTRLYIEQVRGGQNISNEIQKAHRILMTMNREESGLGINMVMSTQDFKKICRT